MRRPQRRVRVRVVLMKRLRNLTLCVAALLLFGARAVDGRASQTVSLRASQTVEVRVGQEVSVAGKLKIKFVAVREDSRCPEGVQCIWAGSARLALRLSRAGAKAATVELNTGVEPREITYANHTIKLTGLAPRPTQDQPPKSRAYVATFAVSKKG